MHSVGCNRERQIIISQYATGKEFRMGTAGMACFYFMLSHDGVSGTITQSFKG